LVLSAGAESETTRRGTLVVDVVLEVVVVVVVLEVVVVVVVVEVRHSILYKSTPQ
jgi:hypothetical protein